MLGAWVLLLIAQVQTSSAAGADFLEDLPLTPEELELLESLRPTATATLALETGATLDHALRVPARRLRTRRARSVGESLREEATAFSTRRRFVSGESPVMGGRGGQRVRLSMDGLELQHALDSLDHSTTLGFVDPWVVEEVVLRSAPSPSSGGFAGHGEVELRGRRPDLRPHLQTELLGLGRLADRSSGFRAAASAALDRAGVTVAGGYSDHDPMRDGAGRHLPGTGDEEASLLARARILDAERDPVQLELGFDAFQITNARRFDQGGGFIDRSRRMLSGFARVLGRLGPASFELLGGARRFDTRREPVAAGVVVEDAADLMQLDGTVRFELGEVLELSVFGAGYASRAHGAAIRGEMLRASGGAAVELEAGPLRGRAAVRGGYLSSEVEDGLEVARGLLLPELRLGLSIHDAWLLVAGYREALHLPTVRDLGTAAAAVRVEHTRTVELEARHDRPAYGLRLGGLSTFVTNPLGFEEGQLVERSAATLLGTELELSLRPFAGFEAVAVFNLMQVVSGERADFIEGGVGALRVRYELATRGAYVELSARHAFPLPASGEAALSTSRRRAWPLPFVSVGGGLELGLGFALSLQVANTFDVAERELNGDIPRPGIDLRLGLEHRFEL